MLDIEHPAISWQAVSPTSLDGPFLHEATGRYIPTERAQAFPIALQQPSTCPASSTDTARYFAEARAQGRFGVVLVGIAREKDSACQDAVCLQKTCDEFVAVSIRSFFERWVHRLPSPFTAGHREAGFFYDLAFRQIEFSGTRVFDWLTAGRARFEATPRAPGPRVARPGGTGLLPAHQPQDCGTLRHQGDHTSCRSFDSDPLQLLEAEAVLQGVRSPANRNDDQRHPRRWRCARRHQRRRGSGAALRRSQTYDLRRPTRRSLIERQKGTHRYRLTSKGRRLSMFFTKIYTRIVTPSPRYLDPGLPPEAGTWAPVARAWRDLDHAPKRPHRSVRGCGLKFDLFQQMLQT